MSNHFLFNSLFAANSRSGSSSKLRPNGWSRCFPNNGPRSPLRVLVDAKSEILYALHALRTPQPRPGQIRVHMQQLQVARGDSVPLHRVRRLRLVRAVLRQGGPPAQDGKARPRPRRGLVAGRHEAGQPARGAQAVYPALHPVAGARLPVPRRQLPPSLVPEDEARRHPYEGLQAQDEGRLSDLQAAHSALLLSRQALPRDEVLGAVLQQYQTEAEAAAGAAARAAAAAAAAAHGGDEHARWSDGRRVAAPAARARARLAASRQALRARAAAQRAEGFAAGETPSL